MKNGATHLAYKAEQAVDLDTGAIVAITTQGGAVGDTTSVEETLPAAGLAVAEQIATPTAQGEYKVDEQGMCEVVTDKGYHSGASLVSMREMGVRSYVSVPQQPRRNWRAKPTSKPPCTPTSGAWKASGASVCCGGAENFWSVPSHISMRPARCEECMFAAEAMLPSECCCKPPRSISR